MAEFSEAQDLHQEAASVGGLSLFVIIRALFAFHHKANVLGKLRPAKLNGHCDFDCCDFDSGLSPWAI